MEEDGPKGKKDDIPKRFLKGLPREFSKGLQKSGEITPDLMTMVKILSNERRIIFYEYLHKPEEFRKNLPVSMQKALSEYGNVDKSFRSLTFARANSKKIREIHERKDFRFVATLLCAFLSVAKTEDYKKMIAEVRGMFTDISIDKKVQNKFLNSLTEEIKTEYDLHNIVNMKRRELFNIENSLLD